MGKILFFKPFFNVETRRALCFFWASFFLFCLPAFAERVKHVIDGDTVVLENGQKVRLIGIDAPEIENRKYGKIGEYYGQEAKRFLSELISGKEVRLESGPEASDKYGRRLAFIFLDDLFVNRELVKQGYAEVFRKFDFMYKPEFFALEQKARDQGLGIWSQPATVSEKKKPLHAGKAAGAAALLGIFVLLVIKRK